MHDAHVHLDFMANGEQVASDASSAGVLLFANTVTPEGYAVARTRFAPFGNVRVGWGLHPWWVDETSMPLECLFPEDERFIGEIGLDFGKHHVDTRQAQIDAFALIARLCAEQGNKVISVHSVHAARETLDILESSGALATCSCIFHWFTGPSDLLKRAIEAGCFFSAGPRMLATGKGREYVKAIPADQLLLETDAPPTQGADYSFAELEAELEKAATAIAAVKGASALEAINDAFKTLFG